ncbi:MAG: YegP family protein, partial [Eggerthellaceae bacterium]|nr:YegP family protein [Eggerthellaceae bacterium]
MKPLNEKVIIMGKFVVKQSKNEQFFFNLKAANGEVIGTSEM